MVLRTEGWGMLQIFHRQADIYTHRQYILEDYSGMI